MFAKAKAAAAKAAADAQVAIDEADRKYGVSDAVAEASAKAQARIDEVDEKYAISESVQQASDRAAERIAEIDEKYAISESVGGAYDQAAERAAQVAGDVKVGLAIGHVDIDPWAGPPQGEFAVRPVLQQDDGSFAYLSDREPRFPAEFDIVGNPLRPPLTMLVTMNGITISSSTGGQSGVAQRMLPLESLECWQVYAAEEGVPGVGGLIGLRLAGEGGVAQHLAYEVAAGVGSAAGAAAAVCSLLDSLTFRYSEHKPHVVPAIFVSFGTAAPVLVANALCPTHKKVAAAALPGVPAAPAPEPETVDAVDNDPGDDAEEEEGEDDYALRLAYTFALMDKHGHGHVSYIQFLSWWKAQAKKDGESKLSDETLETSRTAFQEYDSNQNGTIEFEELDALLKALDLLRFLAELELPEDDGPDPVAAEAEGGDGSAAAAPSQDVWLSRFDFRELLVAAPALSPDRRPWSSPPVYAFVHRRGMLEQGQDKHSVDVHEFEIEDSEADAAGGGGPAEGITVDGVLEGMDNLATRAANPLRTLVTGDKARYTDDGFDLNLTYIEDRLIAMGMPAESVLHKMSRNPAAEVSRFFETKHSGCYRIYNLCIEQYAQYEQTEGQFPSGAVLHYPACDHNPAPLSMIHHFALSVHAWLQADLRNVAAVHCKAGKGRTGTFICAVMMVMRGMSADSALRLFETQRTSDEAKERGLREKGVEDLEGVTGKSQLQYVRQYGELLRLGPERLNASLLTPPTLELFGCNLLHGPSTYGFGLSVADAKDMWLSVLIDQGVMDQPASGVAFCGGTPLSSQDPGAPLTDTSSIVFDCTMPAPPPQPGASAPVAGVNSVTGAPVGVDVTIGLDGATLGVYGPPTPTQVKGDVRLQVFMHRGSRGPGDGGKLPRPELVAFAWLHTSRVQGKLDQTGNLMLPLDEIDIVKPWSRQAIEERGAGPGMSLTVGFSGDALRDSMSSGPVNVNPMDAFDDDDSD